MKLLMEKIYGKFQKIIDYFMFSCLSTVVDTGIVWVLFHWIQIDLPIANSAGVITGFILHYILSAQRVFGTKRDIPAFLIYFATFLLGLVLANNLIVYTYQMTNPFCPKWLSFVISKGVSVVVPFFVMYFLRKYLYRWLNNWRKNHE